MRISDWSSDVCSSDLARRGHPVNGEITIDPFAHTRHHPPQLQHTVELLGVTLQPPLRVVEVLPTPGRVGPDRLQVTVGTRTDPHVLPRRRDRQRTHSFCVLVTQPLPGSIQQDEPSTCKPYSPARLLRRPLRSEMN